MQNMMNIVVNNYIKKNFYHDFEIKSKYHRETVVLLSIAHILGLQDFVLRSMFFLIIILI